jgi:hypothetical protein
MEPVFQTLRGVVSELKQRLHQSLNLPWKILSSWLVVQLGPERLSTMFLRRSLNFKRAARQQTPWMMVTFRVHGHFTLNLRLVELERDSFRLSNLPL